jgi:hypothetical protein
MLDQTNKARWGTDSVAGISFYSGGFEASADLASFISNVVMANRHVSEMDAQTTTVIMDQSICDCHPGMAAFAGAEPAAEGSTVFCAICDIE